MSVGSIHFRKYVKIMNDFIIPVLYYMPNYSWKNKKGYHDGLSNKKYILELIMGKKGEYPRCKTMCIILNFSGKKFVLQSMLSN